MTIRDGDLSWSEAGSDRMVVLRLAVGLPTDALRLPLDPQERGHAWVREKLRNLDELPPWEATTGRDKLWMKHWVREVVISREQREVEELNRDPNFAAQAHEENERRNAIESAYLYGDVERARYFVSGKLGPEFGGLIGRPPQEWGHRFLQRKELTPADFLLLLACHYTYAIRDLWVEKYNKKKRPHAPTAEEIAIGLVGGGIELADLVESFKRTKRRRPMVKVSDAA